MKLIFRYAQVEAGDVQSFVFLPTQPIEWIAGQSIRLEVPAGYGTEERRFTISSAPYEKDIAITTRISGSDFKQALKNLEPGDSINGYAIEGDFTWTETPLPQVFVASGIGITPFHSMLKQRVHEGLPIDALLLHATRDDAIPFKDELDAWQAANPHFKVAYCIGQRMKAKLINDHVRNVQQKFVYLSGPSTMVDEVGASLMDDYSLPKLQLKRDWFTGQIN